MATDEARFTNVGHLNLRIPTMEDPWTWLAAGWRDIRRAPLWSLGYGLVFVLIGLAGTLGLWAMGLESVVPVVAGGFALVGPILAVGLYEISRRHEAGEPLRILDIVFVRIAAPPQFGFMVFFLLFLYLIWTRAALLLYALFAQDSMLPVDEFVRFVLTTPEGLAMLVLGTLIGAALALVAFSISVLSIPILMRKDVDALTACAASFQIVVQAPGPMLLWGWLIAILTALGIAFGFVGLVLVFPLVGHATWHAYRSIVDDA